MHRSVLIVAALGLLTTGTVRADCESDLLQLEAAYRIPDLSPAGKAALDVAKDRSVSALRKDDDATCHSAIAEALPKVGLSLK